MAGGENQLTKRDKTSRLDPLKKRERTAQSVALIVRRFSVAYDLSTDMAQDFVHDAEKRLCCIYYDATVGYVFFCGV